VCLDITLNSVSSVVALSVCPSVTSQCSLNMAECVKLFLGTAVTIGLSHIALQRS